MERLENGQCGTQIDLVILDKLDYFLFSSCDGALLSHFLIKLYECRNVVIITHISFSEWAQVLVVTKMTTATLNSLLNAAISLNPAMTAMAFEPGQKQKRKPQMGPPL